MDILVRVLGFEEQQLRHHQVGHVVLHRPYQEDHPLLKQPGVDVEGALAAGGLLDDDGHQPQILRIGHACLEIVTHNCFFL